VFVQLLVTSAAFLFGDWDVHKIVLPALGHLAVTEH
jgi:hypothetical protein